MDMGNRIKLTRAQKKVIKLLQDNEIIEHNDRNFMVSEKQQFHIIQWRVWVSLTKELGLIYQEGAPHFNWVLTKKGEELKL